MSLFCHEHGTYLTVDREAFAVTTEGLSDAFTAICDLHVPEVALEDRLPVPEPDTLNIHFLFSQPNPMSKWFGDPVDNLSWSRMELGDYRFSIPRELASRILPRSLEFILDQERKSQDS